MDAKQNKYKRCFNTNSQPDVHHTLRQKDNNMEHGTTEFYTKDIGTRKEQEENHK